MSRDTEAAGVTGDAELAASAVQTGMSLGTRIFYPIRVVTVLGGMLVGFLYTYHFGTFGGFGYFVAITGTVYPHLLYFLQQRFEAKRRIAHLTLLVDAFFAGCVIFLLSFSFQASLTMALIALVTPIAFTGPGMLPWTSLSLALGMLIPVWLLGVPPPAREFPLLDYLSAGYMFAFFGLFTNAVYGRAKALLASRRELREQQLRSEIEKKRSDGLLGSIVPPLAVDELRATGAIAPRTQPCDFLVVAVPALGRPAAEAPAETALALTEDILGSLDAIAARFNLEAVNAALDTYVAVGGLDRAPTRPDDARRAGDEIRAWFDDFNTRRRAAGLAPVVFGTAVGGGPLVVGAVQLRRLVYAVSGDALSSAIAAAHRAAAGSDAGP